MNVAGINTQSDNKILRWLPIIFIGITAVVSLIGLYYTHRSRSVQEELAELDREIKAIQLRNLKQQTA